MERACMNRHLIEQFITSAPLALVDLKMQYVSPFLNSWPMHSRVQIFSSAFEPFHNISINISFKIEEENIVIGNLY